ncbi:unnamed protein product, partial [Cylicocyclus nassatus]
MTSTTGPRGSEAEPREAEGNCMTKAQKQSRRSIFGTGKFLVINKSINAQSCTDSGKS